MQTQPDTIFIQGLQTDITEERLAARFGSIGVIKVSDRCLFKLM